MTDPSSTMSLDADFGIMVPVLLLIGGLAIWLFGARVLRAAMATLGLLVGGLVGWAIGVELHGIAPVPPWVMMLITGLTLACAAALAHRLVITGVLMLVLGLAGPMVVWSVADLQVPEFDVRWGESPEEPPEDAWPELPDLAPDELSDWIDARPGSSAATGDDAPPTSDSEAAADPDGRRDWLGSFRRLANDLGLEDEVMRQRTAEAKSFTAKLLAWARDAWAQTPQEMRTNLIGTTVIGLLAGLLLGSLLPSFCSALVTSVGGGLLWLTSLLAVVDHLGLSEAEWMPSSPVVWAIAWGVISVIGLWIQWINRTRKADKSA